MLDSRHGAHDGRCAQHRQQAFGRTRRGLFRVPEQVPRKPEVPTDSVRRNLGVLLREAKERHARDGRKEQRWGRLDVGCHGRGYQAGVFVDGRRSQLANRPDFVDDLKAVSQTAFS